MKAVHRLLLTVQIVSYDWCARYYVMRDDRKVDEECRTMPNLAHHINEPTVLADNLMHNRQAEPCGFPVCARLVFRVKGVKDVADVVRRNASSRVPYFKLHPWFPMLLDFLGAHE